MPPFEGRRRLVAGGATLAVAAVGVAVAFVLRHGDGASSPAASASATASAVAAPASVAAATTAPVTPLTGPAKELVDALLRARGGTFHARYGVVNLESTPSASTSHVELELWRSGTQAREDTMVTSTQGDVHTAVFQLPNGSFSCTQGGANAWSCTRGGTSPSITADGVVDTVTRQLAGSEVNEKDATIAGHAARCYVIARSDASSQICIDADGIPVAIVAGQLGVQITELGRDVNASVFALPGPVR